VKTRHAATIREGLALGHSAARIALRITRGRMTFHIPGPRHAQRAMEHSMRRDLSGSGILLLGPDSKGRLTVRPMWDFHPNSRSTAATPAL
jgi:hypothetical protein